MKTRLARKNRTTKTSRKFGIPPRGTKEFINFLDDIDTEYLEKEEVEDYNHFLNEAKEEAEQEAIKASGFT